MYLIRYINDCNCEVLQLCNNLTDLCYSLKFIFTNFNSSDISDLEIYQCFSDVSSIEL